MKNNSCSKLIMLVFYCFMIMIIILLVPNFAKVLDQDLDDAECSKVRRCKQHGHGGPEVRFPFRLRDHHPPHCGYPDPGFELSCTEKKYAVIELPRSSKLFVKKIDYRAQQIHIYDPDHHGCLPRLLLNNPNLDISASPFKYAYRHGDFPYYSDFPLYLRNYVLFNCSLTNDDRFDDYRYTRCLSNPKSGYGIKAVDLQKESSHINTSIMELTGCRKMDVLPYVPRYVLYSNDLYLNWSIPNCSKCETQGRRRRGCRILKNTNSSRININITTSETECFNLPKQYSGEIRKQVITGAVLGSFLLILAAIGLYYVHRTYILEKENGIKIKQFLEDYTALKSTRYSYADIKRITNQFKEKLGQGGYGTVYKGTLSNNILVAVKVLNHSLTGNGEEFINEVGAMGRIHHINVARLVGFCADGSNRALVYEFMPNESLEKFIFSENGKNVVLGWEKLQDIALGIAKGMEYLHHGCNQQILHFDIKPHNILLDQNFNPKISDFGLAKLCSKEKSVVTMTAARGTMGYIAPEVASRNFGKPSYKSDVYSFGMLLLEMVGGRKNIDVKVEKPSQVYFPEWVYEHLDQGRELGIQIEDAVDSKIAKKLAVVALRCIQWYPADRPSMKDVVHMLEGEEDNLTMPPNPFVSGDGTKKIPTRPLNMELEIITEAE